MRRLTVGTAFLFASALSAASVFADFQNVSTDAGLLNTGESYGASWGDFNGDGYPDLWVSNHARAPALYLNNQDGTFTDIAPLVWPGRFVDPDTICDAAAQGVCLADTHGAAWIDFDNDGDQDLIELVGGVRSNHFFENDAGELFERAAQFALGAPEARSRSPAFIDWNRDGLLDAVLTHALNATDQPLLLTNQGNIFADAGVETGIGEHNAVAAYLADISEDGQADIVLSSGNLNSGPVFSTDSLPFTNVAAGLSIPGVQRRFGCVDAAFEDFNGDLRTDVFAVCGGGGREVVLRSDQRLEARITAVQGETAVEFDAATPIVLSVYPGFLLDPEENLGVGGSGIVPEVLETPELGWQSFELTLDPANPDVQGTPAFTAGVDQGLFVSFDSGSNRWRLGLSTPGGVGISLVVTTPGVISDVEAIGFDATPAASQPVYLHRVNGGFSDQRIPGAMALPLPCVSVVAADVDNDADMDLYLVCARTITNLENRLFLNDGNGVFVEQPGAFGATASSLGSGDSVAVADFDQDGFVDLYVTNGNGGAPFHFGPEQLFRNLGNDNHWIELDLVGTTSNRDAIGAVVTVDAGGKRQRRLQNGGFHRKSQNHQRLHFGLGQNDMIDEIVIDWPSGERTTLVDVAADQILAVEEAVDPDLDDDGVPNEADNCTLRANANQVDADGDGFGNRCDADFNDDCVVNVQDLGLFRTAFFTSEAEFDLDSDGVVNAVDLGILRTLFFDPPGPSGLSATCAP